MNITTKPNFEKAVYETTVHFDLNDLGFSETHILRAQRQIGQAFSKRLDAQMMGLFLGEAEPVQDNYASDPSFGIF